MPKGIILDPATADLAKPSYCIDNIVYGKYICNENVSGEIGVYLLIGATNDKGNDSYS